MFDVKQYVLDFHRLLLFFFLLINLPSYPFPGDDFSNIFMLFHLLFFFEVGQEVLLLDLLTFLLDLFDAVCFFLLFSKLFLIDEDLLFVCKNDVLWHVWRANV